MQAQDCDWVLEDHPQRLVITDELPSCPQCQGVEFGVVEIIQAQISTAPALLVSLPVSAEEAREYFREDRLATWAEARSAVQCLRCGWRGEDHKRWREPDWDHAQALIYPHYLGQKLKAKRRQFDILTSPLAANTSEERMRELAQTDSTQGLA